VLKFKYQIPVLKG